MKYWNTWFLRCLVSRSITLQVNFTNHKEIMRTNLVQFNHQPRNWTILRLHRGPVIPILLQSTRFCQKIKDTRGYHVLPRMEMLSTLPCTVQKPMVRLWCQVSPARIRGNPDLQRELGCFSIVLTWLKCYSDVWSKCILSASTLHTFSS